MCELPTVNCDICPENKNENDLFHLSNDLSYVSLQRVEINNNPVFFQWRVRCCFDVRVKTIVQECCAHVCRISEYICVFLYIPSSIRRIIICSVAHR